MLILRATADILRVVTGSAADVRVHVSSMEADNATPPVIQDIVRVNTASITTATTTTILDCTTANRRRNVKHANLYNNHATTSTTVRVEHTDGTNVEVLANVNLLAGESLVFTQGGVWLHYDANGAVYPSVGNAATQAEQETGTATDRYVSPGRQQFHPSAAKAWGMANGAGTSLIVNYNVAGIVDTGAGLLTFTIGTDFSSANWACVAQVERTTTTLTVTNLKFCNIRNAGQAAGSVLIECYDGTATTATQEDPQNYHFVGFGDQA